MKNIARAVAVAALLCTSPAVAGETVTGWIIQVDPITDSITLDDGQAFLVSEDIGLDSLREGVRVTITYEVTPSGKTVTAIAPASQPVGTNGGGNV